MFVDAGCALVIVCRDSGTCNLSGYNNRESQYGKLQISVGPNGHAFLRALAIRYTYRSVWLSVWRAQNKSMGGYMICCEKACHERLYESYIDVFHAAGLDTSFQLTFNATTPHTGRYVTKSQHAKIS